MASLTTFVSWIITDRENKMAPNEFAPVTPAEMLKEEFLAGYGLSQNALAKSDRHLAESDYRDRQ